MIEIPEPPDVGACGACMHPLRWLWDPTIVAWVAFVPGPSLRTPELHGCRPLQAPRTWRALSATPTAHQHEINAAGRARAVEAIKSKSADEKENEA